MRSSPIHGRFTGPGGAAAERVLESGAARPQGPVERVDPGSPRPRFGRGDPAPFGGAEPATELAARLTLTERFPDLGSWTWYPASERLHASARFRELLGLAPDQRVTIEDALSAMPREDAEEVRSLLRLVIDDGVESCALDHRVCSPDGSMHWMEGYCLALRDEQGAVEKVMGLSRDVTARVEAAADSMRVQHELASARDYLRAVTDTMDESMFTLDGTGLVEYINPAAERLLGWSRGELLGKLMHAVLHSERQDGSVYPTHECPIMIARAEGRVVEVERDTFVRRDGTHLPVSYTALPFSTEAGIEGCVVIFEDITERLAEQRRVARDREKLEWAARIRDALEEERFELYCQPIVDCRSGRVVQRELLLRLNDPQEGLISPGAFLPAAEELGLIRAIDHWVVGRAAVIARDRGAVEVNLSARSIGDPHLIDHIGFEIERAGVDPGLLVFEITETALIADEGSALSFLERLHRLGCKIALDDFGTGYGSFTYLKQLPVDILKIDAEFVRDLLEDERSRNVVEAVVGLARGFGLLAVAEGVEDQETFELLVSLGVDRAQGFHLGRPCPLDTAPGAEALLPEQDAPSDPAAAGAPHRVALPPGGVERPEAPGPIVRATELRRRAAALRAAALRQSAGR